MPQPERLASPQRLARPDRMTSPDLMSGPGLMSRASPIPQVPGILTADQVLATGRSIAADQQASGAIGWPDGHIDAWNHVECAMALTTCGLDAEARRAYAWLARTQRADGSWAVTAADGTSIEDHTEANHAAYVAVGVWHDLLVTGDEDFAARMWPVVRAAIEFAVGLQTARGEIIWRRLADGSADSYALLTGNASMYQSLGCAVALADRAGEPQPDWELAAVQLGHALACHPEAFADKSRFSMDWYYPVLGGALRGAAAAERLARGWDTFVVPGLGVRCVSDQPWVTVAETCELVLALDACGQRERAREVFAAIGRLRHDDGSYWTGWQYVNENHFPAERSGWTSAAAVLAADALAGFSGGAAVFRAVAPSFGARPPADPAACGCEANAADALTGHG
jgi:hypothetical protein